MQPVGGRTRVGTNSGWQAGSELAKKWNDPDFFMSVDAIPAGSRNAMRPRDTTLAWITICLATLAAYYNTFSVPFFFDDSDAITDNSTIRHLSAWREVLSPPRDGSGVAGRPIVNLSLAVNYALGGTNVVGYHIFNLAVHLASALLLFGICRRTLRQRSVDERFQRAADPLALTIALLWALHPLQTESVTGVVQRTELLVGFFYLLTLYAFIRTLGTERPGKWAVLAVVACAGGMASKEVMVTAPVVILFYDRTFGAGSFREAWRRHKALHLGLAATWGVLVYLVVLAGGSRGTAAGFGLGVPWWSYALKQCEAILLYLRLAFWPHPLVLDYGAAVIRRPVEIWPQALSLAGLIAGTLVALRRWPMIGYLGFWFFAILAPSSSVVPLVTQTVAEHRTYLSLAGVIGLVVIGLYRVAGSRGLVVLAGTALVLLEVTMRRNADYESALSLWTRTVAQRPDNARAHSNLGGILLLLNLPAEAIGPCEMAVRLNPDLADAQNNLGSALARTGAPLRALPHYERALRLKPTSATAQSNMGGTLLQLGRLQEAVPYCEAALRLDPNLVEAHYYLGNIYLQTGRPAEAIGHYEAALRQRPDYSEALCNLGNVFYQLGRLPEAIDRFEAALRLQPKDSDAHNNLGSALFQVGRTSLAVAHYREALRLNPDNLSARNNLAAALLQMGQAAEAVDQYRLVVDEKPDSPEARYNLGAALARCGRRAEAAAELEAALRLRPDFKPARDSLSILQESP